MIKRSARLTLAAMDAHPCVPQPVNQHVVHHRLHPHPHHAPFQYQYLAHSQDLPDSQDAWDRLDCPDAVDSPVSTDVWDQWDQWDHLDHPDAPVSRRHHLLPVHPSVFTTVWRSVPSHAAPPLLPCTFPLLLLQCQFVLRHVLQPAVNKK